MAVFGDAVQSLGGSQVVGQYFTVVSFIPSTVLTSYVIVLAKSGAWGGNHVNLAHAFTSLDAKDAVALGFGSLAVALALFPLQYRMIQWLEGYWGRSRPALRIAAAATARHRKRYLSLLNSAYQYEGYIDGLDPQGEDSNAVSESATPREIRPFIDSSEAIRLAAYYPEALAQVMPTRLGNVLRRHERTAGAVYGLDAMAVVPRLLLVSDEKHTTYVRAQRTNLDLAVRTSITAMIATITTIVFMWPHGWWLLLALVPYTLAFAAYLGAVRAAYDYGLAFATLLDLNRFTLYEKLHLQLPETYGAEREQNKTLMKLLRNSVMEYDEPDPDFQYEHPQSPAPPPTTQNQSLSHRVAGRPRRGRGS